MSTTFFPPAPPDQSVVDEADNAASALVGVRLRSARLMREAIDQAAREADAMLRLELALSLSR